MEQKEWLVQPRLNRLHRPATAWLRLRVAPLAAPACRLQRRLLLSPCPTGQHLLLLQAIHLAAGHRNLQQRPTEIGSPFPAGGSPASPAASPAASPTPSPPPSPISPSSPSASPPSPYSWCSWPARSCACDPHISAWGRSCGPNRRRHRRRTCHRRQRSRSCRAAPRAVCTGC